MIPKFPIKIKSGSALVRIYQVRHKSTASGFIYTVSYSIGPRRYQPQFVDLDDAVNEARLRANQLSTGKMDSAGFSKSDSDELAAARKVAGATPLLSALAEWSRARQLTGGNVLAACESWKARNMARITRKTVAAVIVEFKADKTKQGYNVAKDHASRFRIITEGLGEQYIDAVTSSQLSGWLAKFEDPGTRNTFRKRIVSIWRWAQKRGYLAREAKTEAEQTEAAREEAPIVGIISTETLGKLLEYVRANHPDYLPALVLSCFCGMRRGEVHGQLWPDINLAEKHVHVTTAKRGTAARRLVPLCDAAVEWLMLCSDRTEAVCANLAVDRIRHITLLAKFVLPENCFRHSFISHRVAQTGNVAETALEAGNSPSIIHRHYRELVSKAEGAAWFEVRPATVTP